VFTNGIKYRMHIVRYSVIGKDFITLRVWWTVEIYRTYIPLYACLRKRLLGVRKIQELTNIVIHRNLWSISLVLCILQREFKFVYCNKCFMHCVLWVTISYGVYHVFVNTRYLYIIIGLFMMENFFCSWDF